MRRPENPEPTTSDGSWTFLSNHGHVLLCIAADPEIRLRDVADRVGITERAVQRIVADLETGQYVTRIRIGRRNRYQVHSDRNLRHPIESQQAIRKLFELLPEIADGCEADGPKLRAAE